MHAAGPEHGLEWHLSDHQSMHVNPPSHSTHPLSFLSFSTWAHALIDSGATVYVSHGDPRLQGIEIYNGCPIFFCLGSFIFQTKTEIGFYGPEVWQSCIATLEYHAHNSTPPLPPPHAAPHHPQPTRSVPGPLAPPRCRRRPFPSASRR